MLKNNFLNLRNDFFLIISVFFLIECGDTMTGPSSQKSKSYKDKDGLDDDIKILEAQEGFKKLPYQKKIKILSKYNASINSNNPFASFCNPSNSSFIKDLSNLYYSKDSEDKNIITSKFYHADLLFYLCTSENNENTLNIFIKDKDFYKALIEKQDLLLFYIKYKNLFETHYKIYNKKGMSKADFMKKRPYIDFKSFFINENNENLRKKKIKAFTEVFSEKEDEMDSDIKKLHFAITLIDQLNQKFASEEQQSMNDEIIEGINTLLKDEKNRIPFMRLFFENKIPISAFGTPENILLIKNLLAELGIKIDKELTLDDLIKGLKKKFGELKDFTGPKSGFIKLTQNKEQVQKNKYPWLDNNVEKKYNSNPNLFPSNLGNNNELAAKLLGIIKKTIPTQGNTLKTAFQQTDSELSTKIDSKGCGIISALIAWTFIQNLNGNTLKDELEWRFPDSNDILKVLEKYNNSSLSPKDLFKEYIENSYKQDLIPFKDSINTFLNPILAYIYNHVGLLPADWEERYENTTAIGFTNKENVISKLQTLNNKILMILNTSGENLHWHLGIYDKASNKITILETGNEEPAEYKLEEYLNKMEVKFEDTIGKAIDKNKDSLDNFFMRKKLKEKMKEFLQKRMIGNAQKNIKKADVKYSIVLFE